MRNTLAILFWASLSTLHAQDIDLAGRVLDGNNNPLSGVVVQLGEAGLVDTTGSDGTWQLQSGITSLRRDPSTVGLQQKGASLEILWQQGLPRVGVQVPGKGEFDLRGRRLQVLPGARPVQRVLRREPSDQERLVYSRQGQIITEDQIASYIEQGIERWIQEFVITSRLIPDARVEVDSVFAWFDGGRMTTRRRARFGYQRSTHQLSGRVYTIKSPTGEVFDFRVWLNVMGNSMRLTAVSDTVEFTSDFGNVEIAEFGAGNALPLISGEVDTVSINDTAYLHVHARDTLGGSVLRWEYSVDSADWQLGSDTAIAIAVGLTARSIPWSLRAMDNDSNWISSSGVVVVEQDPPVLSAIQGLANPLATVLTNYSVSVQQRFGTITEIAWRLNSGAWVVGDSTHGFTFPAVGSYQIAVRVTDDDGNVVQATRQISTHNDTPVITGVANQLYWQTENELDFLTFSDSTGIASIVWNLGDGTIIPGNNTWINHTWNLGRYTITVTATDNLGASSQVSFAIEVRALIEDSRNDRVYRVAKFGNQVWMTENLDYGTYVHWGMEQSNNSVVEKYCDNQDEDLCEEVGGLYQWAEAMGLPNSCNEQDCSASITAPHRGICPEGYHVPTDAEWQLLEAHHGMAATTSTGWRGLDPDISRRMRSEDYWLADYEGTTIPGIDSLGFGFQPGGMRLDDPMSYPDPGHLGTAITATQVNSWEFYGRSMEADQPGVNRNTMSKIEGYSLRCVADGGDTPVARAVVSPSRAFTLGQIVSLSATGSMGSWVGPINQYAWSIDGGAFAVYAGGNRTLTLPNSEGLTRAVLRVRDGSYQYAYDTLFLYAHPTITDARDSRAYPTVKIGDQIWLAANLNYGTAVTMNSNTRQQGAQKFCRENISSNCNTLGGYYQWHTMMGLDSTCLRSNTGGCALPITGNIQGVCPSGWHVPRKAEWEELRNYVLQYKGAEAVGTSLATQANGWSVPGVDRFGFAAIPSGGSDAANNLWWALSSLNVWQPDEYSQYGAYFWSLASGADLARIASSVSKYRATPVRCIQN